MPGDSDPDAGQGKEEKEMSKDYQGAIAVFKNYVDFHDCHSKSKPRIGEEAIEVLREAVGKAMKYDESNTLMKPIETTKCFDVDLECYIAALVCPKCHHQIWDEYTPYNKPNYCPYCGQRLDSEEKKMKDYQKALDFFIRGFGSDKADDLVRIEKKETGGDTYDLSKEDLQELVDRDKPMLVKRFPERTLCPKCGAVVTGGSFCIHCGQRLDFGVIGHEPTDEEKEDLFREEEK